MAGNANATRRQIAQLCPQRVPIVNRSNKVSSEKVVTAGQLSSAHQVRREAQRLIH